MASDVGFAPAWWDILRRAKVESIIPLERDLITLSSDDTVASLSKKLKTGKVHSVLVTFQEALVIGFIDNMDLMQALLKFLEKKGETISSAEFTFETVRRWTDLSKEFETLRISSVMELLKDQPGPSRGFVGVSASSSLLEAMETLSKKVHRMAVLDECGKKVVNVVSQLDVIRFLAKEGVWIGKDLEATIKGTQIGTRGVITVPESSMTAEALNLMRNKNVPAAGVVDKAGRLVSVLSSSDLELRLESIAHLTLSVKEFLSTIHGSPRPLVFAKENTTIETLLLKVVVHQVHRVFIVSESMYPLGVVSLTDLIIFFLSRKSKEIEPDEPLDGPLMEICPIV